MNERLKYSRGSQLYVISQICMSSSLLRRSLNDGGGWIFVFWVYGIWLSLDIKVIKYDGTLSTNIVGPGTLLHIGAGECDKFSHGPPLFVHT